MPRACLDAVVTHLRQLAADATDECTDAELLQRFVTGRDEQAFAALVQRHALSLRGVCRRVLGSDAEVDDAVQAVLLVLARKAGSIRPGVTLSSWLYGVAYRVAMNAKRAAQRRQVHEARVRPRAPDRPEAQVTLAELQGVLDEEIARLPAKYREPFVRCCLEGQSKSEAARQLGWKEGTVSGRLAQARERLRQRLARRGITLSAALTVVGCSLDARAAVPPALIRAAVQWADGETNAVAASAARLAQGILRSSGATGLTLVAGAILATALLAGGGGLMAVRSQANRPAEQGSHDAEPALRPTEAHRGTDRYGDPLPAGALARLGTVRLRQAGLVMSVAFTPDGTKVLSGGWDRHAFLWDVATGKRLKIFPGGAIDTVAVSPDGKLGALADHHTGAVLVYDLNSGRHLATLAGHHRGPCCCCFSPDGKTLASGGADGSVRLWLPTTGKEKHVYRLNPAVIRALQYTRDGTCLAALGNDGVVRILEPDTGKELARFGSTVRPIHALCLAADGKTLLTSTNSCPSLIRGWDLATGRLTGLFAENPDVISALAASPNGKTLWAATPWGALMEWDLGSRTMRRRLPHGPEQIFSLAVSPDGKRLVGGTYDARVILWDTATGQRVPDLVGHDYMVLAVRFTPDGTGVWTAGSDGTLRLWGCRSTTVLRTLNVRSPTTSIFAPAEHAYSLALSSDGQRLAAGLVWRARLPQVKIDTALRLWDARTGRLSFAPPGNNSWVSAVAFSPNGNRLVSQAQEWPEPSNPVAGPNLTLRLWDVKTGRTLRRISGLHGGGDGLAFSPNGSLVIAALTEQSIGFWDVASGRLVRQLPDGSGGNLPLLSPDGRLLLTGGRKTPLRVWEVASGKERLHLRPAHQVGAGNCCAISADGRWLALGDYSGPLVVPVEMWDLRSGMRVAEFGRSGAHGDVMSLAFAPDNRRLAAGYCNGTVLIWDVLSGVAQPGKPLIVSDTSLTTLWNNLADEDAAHAHEAQRRLLEIPEQAVGFLGRQLQLCRPPDPQHIARLLAQLDSPSFRAREKATSALSELGPDIEPELRRILSGKASLELRQRGERLLTSLAGGRLSRSFLRIARAVEVLEQLGTRGAQRVLQRLVESTPDHFLRREAQAALGRLRSSAAGAVRMRRLDKKPQKEG